jgi:hypothetical protein
MKRSLEAIRTDLRDGKITPAYAAKHYGVVFTDGCWTRRPTAREVVT